MTWLIESLLSRRGIGSKQSARRIAAIAVVLLTTSSYSQDHSGTLQIIYVSSDWVMVTSDSRRINKSIDAATGKIVPHYVTDDKRISIGDDGICVASGSIGYSSLGVDYVQNARLLARDKQQTLAQRAVAVALAWQEDMQHVQNTLGPTERLDDSPFKDGSITNIFCAGIEVPMLPVVLQFVYRETSGGRITLWQSPTTYGPHTFYTGVPQIADAVFQGKAGWWNQYQPFNEDDRFDPGRNSNIARLSIQSVHRILRGIYEATESDYGQTTLYEAWAVGPPNKAWLVEGCGVWEGDLNDLSVWKSHCK